MVNITSRFLEKLLKITGISMHHHHFKFEWVKCLTLPVYIHSKLFEISMVFKEKLKFMNTEFFAIFSHDILCS